MDDNAEEGGVFIDENEVENEEMLDNSNAGERGWTFITDYGDCFDLINLDVYINICVCDEW